MSADTNRPDRVHFVWIGRRFAYGRDDDGRVLVGRNLTGRMPAAVRDLTWSRCAPSRAPQWASADPPVAVLDYTTSPPTILIPAAP